MAGENFNDELFLENATYESNLRMANTLSIIFNETDEPLAEAVTFAQELNSKYTFQEPSKFLNISTKDHALMSAQEKDGQSPMYPIFEVPSGFSRYRSERSIAKPNAIPKTEDRHRYWPSDVIQSMAPQIRERQPVGYLGHEGFMSDGSVPTNVPIKWLTAVKAIRKEDNTPVILARGYAFDQGLNRTYFNTGVYSNASVNAVGTAELDTTDKGTKDNPVVHIKSAQLDSLDIVRRGNHGLPGTRMVASISEQESVMDEKDKTKPAGETPTSPHLDPTISSLLESVQGQSNVIAQLNVEVKDLKERTKLLDSIKELMEVKEIKDITEALKSLIEVKNKWRIDAVEAMVKAIKGDKTRLYVEQQLLASPAQSLAELTKTREHIFAVLKENTPGNTELNLSELSSTGEVKENVSTTNNPFSPSDVFAEGGN